MDEQAPDQSPSSVPVWGLLDRSDPAWKALYSLYNPDDLQGRSTGLQYSLQNRQAMQKRVAARAAAAASAAAAERAAEQQQKPIPKKKVAVPHFRRQTSDTPTDPLAAVPKRRPGQAIKAAQEAEAQQAWGQAPVPAGRLLDEQEKQRCALLMQFKGNIPCPSSQLTPAGRAKVAAAQARCISTSSGTSSSSSSSPMDAAVSRIAEHRALLQRRFEEVEQEVAEREEFVGVMQQLGGLQLNQMTAMRAEAAAKVKEMRQLDEQIRGLDAQLRQAASTDS